MEDERDGDERDIIVALREQSRRKMQMIFTALSLGALAAGIAVHLFGGALAFFQDQPEPIANCFLFMGVAYAMTVFLWDRLLAPQSEEESR